MKIVLVSDSIYPYFKGGVEKRLHELSTRLATLGHDVHIYTMHWWPGPEKERVEEGRTLHAISPLYPMYKGNIRSIKEGVMFGLHCLKLFRVQWDVLDVDHMPYFPIYSAWLVCLLRGRRRSFFGTWHEALSRKDWTDYMGALGLVSCVIEHFAIKMPTFISAASEHTARGLRDKHGRSRGVSVVSPGIDTKLIQSVKPAADGPDVLYIGRLMKDKNVDKLIDAIQILRAGHPAIRCTIIGHGPEKEHLQKQIKQLKLGGNIKLLEPLAEDTEVYAAMKSARVFCLPSVREGFGMTVLEALGCGTPVVTVDAPANASKDLVQDGKTGSVVVLSPQSLADELDHWLGQPKPKDIASSVQSFDWDALARKQAEVYTQ